MGIEPNWFHSYLTNRKQVVVVNDCLSDTQTITCGVPQGSILGPLLYLCYVNDMSTAISENCKLLLYADDSVLMVSDKNPDLISNELGQNVNSCFNWLVDNRLSLHFGKTECILFGPKNKLKNVNNFVINCGNNVIKPSNNVKYLGVTLDNDLSGKSIAESVVSKSTARLKFLYRQANYLNVKTKRTLCNSLVLCNLEYASAAWYTGLTKSLKKKLQIIQNKSVRYIYKLDSRAHVGFNELQQLGWLNVNYRQMQLRLNLMYNIYNNSAPAYLCNNFTPLNNVHNHNTRLNGFYLPNIKGEMSKTFCIQGVKDWNDLPRYIQSSPSAYVYKKYVKGYLVDKARNEHQADYIYY